MFNVFSSKEIKGNQLEKGISKPGNIRITQFQQQKIARLDKNSPFELNQPTTPSAFGTLGARHANKATWALRRQSTRALSDLAALVDLAVCKSEAWLHFKTVVCNFLMPVVWFFKNYKRHPPSNVTKYLRLPWKKSQNYLKIDPRHIWSVIDNARRNRTHPPKSPNIAPAKKCFSWFILVTYDTSFTMRGATILTPQNHELLLNFLLSLDSTTNWLDSTLLFFAISFVYRKFLN